MKRETAGQCSPEPWTLETVGTQVGVCHKIGPVGATTKIKHACLYDDCYSAEPRDMQLLADARLMTAARDLLIALKCIRTLSVESGYEKISAICKKAIAKAEGRDNG